MAVGSRMSGQVAIVTGSGSGIGATIAQRLSEEGAWVACVDINHDAAKQTAQTLKYGGWAYQADVATENEVGAVIEHLVKSKKKINILVNNAGIAGPQAPVTGTSLHDWMRTLSVNLTGTFLFSKQTMPYLISSKGCIVNIASALALVGWENECAYGPSKAGVVQLTKGMALDYAPDVRVNCVCPGAVRTPMIESLIDHDDSFEETLREYGKIHPLHKRLAYPSEIADGVVFLASGDASLITGAVLPIDAGFTAA